MKTFHTADQFTHEIEIAAQDVSMDKIELKFIGKDDKITLYQMCSKGSGNYLFGFDPNETGNPEHLLHKDGAVIFTAQIHPGEDMDLIEQELRPNGSPFVTVYMPVTKKSYARQGIATTAYKMLTDHYNIVSSSQQSDHASAMWENKICSVVKYMYSAHGHSIATSKKLKEI